jgi:hypothetical protein
MAKEQPQLVRLAVANTAGKDVREWWTGEPAVTFDAARKIAEQWARNVADAAETTRRAEAEREAQIERELEEGRRQAAERAKREPRRVLHGVEVSLPGDPAPPWMGDQ